MLWADLVFSWFVETTAFLPLLLADMKSRMLVRWVPLSTFRFAVRSGGCSSSRRILSFRNLRTRA